MRGRVTRADRYDFEGTRPVQEEIRFEDLRVCVGCCSGPGRRALPNDGGEVLDPDPRVFFVARSLVQSSKTAALPFFVDL